MNTRAAAIRKLTASESRPGTGRRELILSTARQLMVDQGVKAVTMRGVARAAGIAPGNLSYYFATYDDLLHGLVDWVLEPYLKTFAFLRADAGDDPVAGLHAVLEFVLDDLASKETTMFFPELWVLGNRSNEAAGRMRELYDAYMAVLKDLIAAARPDLGQQRVDELALFVCASIEGQTVFIGNQRPHAEHRSALKQLALETMVSAVINDGEGTT